MTQENIENAVNVLKTFIPSEDIYTNEPMSKHTTFKIGGNADLFIKIRDKKQLNQVIELSNKIDEPLRVIGNGSNILVRDEGIRGIVAKICTNTFEFIDSETLRVDSGMLNGKVAQILLEHGLTGFEFAAGIPGTIGGAVKMNAGAYGSQMSDIIVSTRYIDLADIDNSESTEYAIKEINNGEHEFEYRHSMFSNKKAIILDTTLKFMHEYKEKIKAQMEENIKNRREKQPIDKPSAGSTFKRGEDFLTAQLIDKCGLKGYTIGGAQISEKHAGFIVNKGNATAKDVIELIKYTKEQVFEKFNKEIELEIEIV